MSVHVAKVWWQEKDGRWALGCCNSGKRGGAVTSPFWAKSVIISGSDKINQHRVWAHLPALGLRVEIPPSDEFKAVYYILRLSKLFRVGD